jgi:hypothetical protein
MFANELGQETGSARINVEVLIAREATQATTQHDVSRIATKSYFHRP